MNLNTYQKKARETASYPHVGKNLSYLTMGLCGESGEVTEKIKKVFRDHGGKVSVKMRNDVSKELGDTLWYLANLCSELKLDLDDIAKVNLEKIKSRVKRNRVNGSGDDR